MNGTQIRKRRLHLEKRLNELSKHMAYNPEIEEILDELEKLREECPHENVSNGTCINCLKRI